MVFGSKLRLPVDIVIRLPETLPTVEATSTYVLNLVQNRGEVHHSACLKDDVVHQVQKDSLIEMWKEIVPEFSPGDIMWLLDTVVQRGSGQKSSTCHGKST